MGRKNKGFQISTTPLDRAEKTRTFRLTFQQDANIVSSGLLKGRTFSDLARHSIDFYLKAVNRMNNISNEKWLIRLRNTATNIGNGVESNVAADFLMAWLESKPLPDLVISKESLSSYTTNFAGKNFDYTAKLASSCFDYIMQVINAFFADYLNTMLFYVIFQRIQKTNDIAESEKDSIYYFFEGIQEMSIANLRSHVRYSPDLRFVIHMCNTHGMFNKRVEVPPQVISTEMVLKQYYDFIPNFVSE